MKKIARKMAERTKLLLKEEFPLDVKKDLSKYMTAYGRKNIEKTFTMTLVNALYISRCITKGKFTREKACNNFENSDVLNLISNIVLKRRLSKKADGYISDIVSEFGKIDRGLLLEFSNRNFFLRKYYGYLESDQKKDMIEDKFISPVQGYVIDTIDSMFMHDEIFEKLIDEKLLEECFANKGLQKIVGLAFEAAVLDYKSMNPDKDIEEFLTYYSNRYFLSNDILMKLFYSSRERIKEVCKKYIPMQQKTA